jgi:hypothetical protein
VRSEYKYSYTACGGVVGPVGLWLKFREEFIFTIYNINIINMIKKMMIWPLAAGLYPPILSMSIRFPIPADI